MQIRLTPREDTTFDETLVLEEDRERDGTYAEGFSFEALGTIRATERAVSMKSPDQLRPVSDRILQLSDRSIKISVGNSLGTHDFHRQKREDLSKTYGKKQQLETSYHDEHNASSDQLSEHIWTSIIGKQGSSILDRRN